MSDTRTLIDTQESVTPHVLAAMSRAPNPRLVQVMESFVRHMHDFVREIRPTEAEFDQGIAFLNAIGAATNDSHNEGMIFSDATGISTLVCLLANGAGGATETAAALLGPFWRLGQPLTENGGSIVRSPTPGPALFARLRITDLHGVPLGGVEVDVWHSSPVGMYDIQDDGQADMNLRGKFITDADGTFWFRSVKPAGYPIPVHGPTGDLLRAQLRHPLRPAHLHVLAHKPGYKTLITQVFVDDDENLASDVVFGVTQALVGTYVQHLEPHTDPEVSIPWYSLDYAFTMSPGESTLPAPPIK